MAWLFDWWLSLFVARKTIQQLRARVQQLELSLELSNMEIANYKRLHEAAVDTVQAFGLHNRTIGMEAKVYAAEMMASSASSASNQ